MPPRLIKKTVEGDRAKGRSRGFRGPRSRAITPGMRRRQARKESERLLMDDSGMTPENEREQRELMLALAAANQQNRFTNPDTLQTMKEDHPLAKAYIEEELFPSVGFNPKGGQDSSKYHWSAATVSDLASAFDPEFQKASRHSDYIRRGFQGEGNYAEDKISRRTDFKEGDILFQGRVDEDGNPLGPQTYNQFKKDAKGKGEWGKKKGYGSHSDIIIGFGSDKKGKYYTVQGGNVGDTLSVKKIYAKDLAKKYAGRLTQ